MAVVLKPPPRQARLPAKCLAEGQRRVILVGIGGPSGSGKTTLARELVNHFWAPLGCISADHFYDHSRAPIAPREWKPKRAKVARNLETPETIDTELLLSELYRIGRILAEEPCLPQKMILDTPLKSGINLSKKGWHRPGTPLGTDPVVLFVEGFLLFHDEEVANACTHRLWLDIDCDSAMRRRYARDGDPDCDMDEKFEKWYREFVWQNYKQHRSQQLDNAERLEPPVYRIDGRQSPEQVLSDALTFVEKHMWPSQRCEHVSEGTLTLTTRRSVRNRSKNQQRSASDDSRSEHATLIRRRSEADNCQYQYPTLTRRKVSTDDSRRSAADDSRYQHPTLTRPRASTDDCQDWHSSLALRRPATADSRERYLTLSTRRSAVAESGGKHSNVESSQPKPWWQDSDCDSDSVESGCRVRGSEATTKEQSTPKSIGHATRERGSANLVSHSERKLRGGGAAKLLSHLERRTKERSTANLIAHSEKKARANGAAKLVGHSERKMIEQSAAKLVRSHESWRETRRRGYE